MGNWFARFASRSSALAGHYPAFAIAVGVIIVWAIIGPFFKFSATWQLVINTGTTIVTFLMVLLVQNAQNRDALAVHLKLDELINAIDAADNTMIEAEDETDKELADLKIRYHALSREHDELKAQLKDATS